ncbi:hypothetical protein GCM10009600_23580 [Oerskovia paurometabola]
MRHAEHDARLARREEACAVDGVGLARALEDRGVVVHDDGPEVVVLDDGPGAGGRVDPSESHGGFLRLRAIGPRASLAGVGAVVPAEARVQEV